MKSGTGLFLIAFASMIFAQDRMVAHVTAEGRGFDSTIILANKANESRNWRLSPRAEDGASLTSVSGTLAAGETVYLSAGTLFNAEAVSHFSIDEGTDIAVSIAYEASNGTGSPAHVSATDEQSHRWRLYPGNWNAVIDGIAVVNPNETAIDVWVRQVGLDGNPLNDPYLLTSLSPNSKRLSLLEDVYENQDNAFFEIYAAWPISLTALRFSRGEALFWSSGAVALPEIAITSAHPSIGMRAVLQGQGDYEVSGTAVIVDERTVRLENFNYNGRGVDVRFVLAMDEDYDTGFTVTDDISGNGAFTNVTMDLTLPEGQDLDSFNSISLWCTLFAVDFGSGVFTDNQ